MLDASEKSHVAAVFVRIETRQKVMMQLVKCKTRVLPVKKALIPRLEWLAATILVQDYSIQLKNSLLRVAKHIFERIILQRSLG